MLVSRVLFLLCLLALASAPRAESDQWLEALRSQPDMAAAHYQLGRNYELGRGVPQNYAEAAKWYTVAAELGHIDAQYHLGRLYQQGLGVEQSDAMAAQWFRRSADQEPCECSQSRPAQ